jgi:hypothetical protein
MTARGNCYVASEALYHLLGGKAAGWTPIQMRWGGDSHWALRHRSGLILDPTRNQFTKKPTDLDWDIHGRGRGFLTREPSRRAAELMTRILWDAEGVS